MCEAGFSLLCHKLISRLFKSNKKIPFFFQKSVKTESLMYLLSKAYVSWEQLNKGMLTPQAILHRVCFTELYLDVSHNSHMHLEFCAHYELELISSKSDSSDWNFHLILQVVSEAQSTGRFFNACVSLTFYHVLSSPFLQKNTPQLIVLS